MWAEVVSYLSDEESFRAVDRYFDGTSKLKDQYDTTNLRIFYDPVEIITPKTISDVDTEIVEFLNSGKVPLSLEARYVLCKLLPGDCGF